MMIALAPLIAIIVLFTGVAAGLVDGVIAALAQDVRLVFLCSPNNPTGNVMPREQLLAIVEAGGRAGAALGAAGLDAGYGFMIAVGIEDIEDIQWDLDQALHAAVHG